MRRFWHLAPALGSAVAGAVLGAAIQAIMNSQFRILASMTVVLALAIIGMLAGLLVNSASVQEAHDRILEQVQALVTVIRSASGEQQSVTESGFEQLVRQLGLLARQAGLSVELLPIDEINQFERVEDDPTTKLVLSAKEELLILDLLDDGGEWTHRVIRDDHLDSHFQAVVEHVREYSPPLLYKRIIQVADPGVGLHEAAIPVTEHLRAMLVLKEEKGHRVSLRVTRKRFPFKFIIVDRSAIILQLHSYDSPSGSLQIWGELLIMDPGHTFVSIFRNIWDEIEDDFYTRTIGADDLSQPSRPRPPRRVPDAGDAPD